MKTIMEKLTLKPTIIIILILKKKMSVFISLISTFSTSKPWRTNINVYRGGVGGVEAITTGNWNFSILETNSSKL